MCLEYEIQRINHEKMNKHVHLVPPLGLAHVLFDDHIFLIICMDKCNKDTNNSGSTLLTDPITIL
jgi:hypothetical protein